MHHILALAAAITLHGQVAPPLGFTALCVREPAYCATVDPAQVRYASAIKTLDAVNSEVNSDIWPMSDERHYGRAEYWAIPEDGYGDCEDYALAKRSALISAGVPAGAVHLMTTITADGTRHAVLGVDTDRGLMVLDNTTDKILRHDQTGQFNLTYQVSGAKWAMF